VPGAAFSLKPISSPAQQLEVAVGTGEVDVSVGTGVEADAGELAVGEPVGELAVGEAGGHRGDEGGGAGEPEATGGGVSPFNPPLGDPGEPPITGKLASPPIGIVLPGAPPPAGVAADGMAAPGALEGLGVLPGLVTGAPPWGPAIPQAPSETASTAPHAVTSTAVPACPDPVPAAGHPSPLMKLMRRPRCPP
jgi:hypothetical protein